MKNLKKGLIIFIHSLILWGLCGAIMGIGMGITTTENAVIIHLIVAPIITVIISTIYFKKFTYTSPLQTGLIFVSFIIFMDAFLVAMIIMKNFEMFKSILGTWLPFCFIFLSTFLTGKYHSYKILRT
jgi:hypothetical protein